MTAPELGDKPGHRCPCTQLVQKRSGGKLSPCQSSCLQANVPAFELLLHHLIKCPWYRMCGACALLGDFCSVANVFFWQFPTKRPRPLMSDSHTEPHHGIQGPPTSSSKCVIKIFQNQAQPSHISLCPASYPSAEPPARDPKCPQLLPYSQSFALMFSHQSPVSALQVSFISNMEITILFSWYITVKYLSKSIPPMIQGQPLLT